MLKLQLFIAVDYLGAGEAVPGLRHLTCIPLVLGFKLPAPEMVSWPPQGIVPEHRAKNSH